MSEIYGYWQSWWEWVTPVEFAAVLTSIAYAWLAARNQIWCWFFGILSSALTLYALYFYFQLYAESLLQIYYIGMAIYGYFTWSKGGRYSSDHTIDSSAMDEKPIEIWSIQKHVWLIIGGIVLTGLMGRFLAAYTAAASTYLDSFTTVFAILATVMTARRVLENWLYWIVIDSISIYLYATRGGYFFAFLFLAYTFIALMGFINWQKQFRLQHA